MIRKHKNILIALTIGVFCTLSQTAAFAEGETLLKVGLQYGKVSEGGTTLSSDSGFQFGVLSEGLFTKMIDFSGSQTLVVMKNGTSTNETAITSPETTETAQLKGKYHIQIGNVLPTYETVLPVFERIKTTVPDAYLAYDDGWRVYKGAYFTEAEFQSNYNMALSQLAPYNVEKAPFNYFAFMVVESGSVKLLYDASEMDFVFAPTTDTGKIAFNKYKYRGFVGLKRFSASDPTVINYIDVEKYLYGVLPYEISPKWPIEAQKAQAVAARNYALTNLGKHKKYGFDVCNTIDCQVYVGANVETLLSNSAVDLTSGIYLKYNGKLAQTVFHSNSGGRTENAENIWSTAFPYLVGVEDPYSIGNPNDTWTVSYTPEQISQKLIAKGYNIGSVINIAVDSYSVNGRSLKTTIYGTNGNVSFEKDKIRGFFGDANFKTNYFTIQSPGGSGVTALTGAGASKITNGTSSLLTASGSSTASVNGLKATNGISTSTLQMTSSDAYVFNGKGWGHGVGMSQWGAKSMADKGFTYEEILKFYYKGTVLENIK